ncbi:MAG: hypothetical protein ABEH40_08300 [Haloferacaceae archaeon]
MPTTIRGTVRGTAERANPAFAAAVVAVPVAGLAYALTLGSVRAHTYVHVMAGVLWTGIDLFMGLVLGPVLGGLDGRTRAAVFRRFTPKMTFLMPSLALVTIAGGLTLAVRVGAFPHAAPWTALTSTAMVVPGLLLIGHQFSAFRDRRWLAVAAVAAVGHAAWLADTLPAFGMTAPEIVAALAIATLLSVLGFGVLLPGEVRVYLETVSADPDADLIGRIGMRNARLAAVQGVLQLAIVLVMVHIRY